MMFNNLRGIISFRARGNKLYGFINAVRESPVICMSQKCQNEEYYGKIYSYDLRKLEKIAQMHNIELKIENKKGLIFKAAKYRYRFGIAAGILIALTFIMYMSNIVVTIEVNGNENVPSEQILLTLDEIGITKGTFIPSINFGTCERRLKIAIDELSWVAIRNTGNRIVIDVNEKADKPQMNDSNLPANIICQRDAQIKSVTIYNGLLNFAIGDGVKKGDVLVSGIYEDAKGNILKLHAMGSIIGVFEESVTFEQAFEVNERVDLEEDTFNYLDFFTFKIPLGINKADYEQYDYSEDASYFNFMGKDIPIGIIHGTYLPYTTQNVTYSIEDAESALSDSILRHEKNFYEDYTVINRNIVQEITDDKIICTVTYELEGEIGDVQEIFVKK